MTTEEHVWRNRKAWTEYSKDFFQPGLRSWESPTVTWGIWGVPESRLQALGDLQSWIGRDVIELGCGTAYFSAWFARLGARPVGLDVTPAQLASAAEFQRRYSCTFPLIEASAEQVPFQSESFDVAFSEYGASIWCDPNMWIPEAARILRPGGELIFLRNSPLSMLCMPDRGPVEQRLVRGLSELGRMEWPDDPTVEFQAPHGELIRLLRRNGFEIEDLIEIIAPPDAKETRFEYVTLEWAKKWPCEEIWRARKR